MEEGFHEPEAQTVAQAHGGDGGCHAPFLHHAGGENPFAQDGFVDAVQEGPQGGVIHHFVFIAGYRDEHHCVAGLFEFVGDGIPAVHNPYGEADQGRRNFQVHEGAAHGILAADGRQFQFAAGFIGAQESGERPAPGMFRMEFGEVFLHGKTQFLRVGPHGRSPAHGFHHGVHGPVVRAPAAHVGIIAAGHDGGGVGLAVEYRQTGRHAFGAGQLVPAAVGHQYAAPADGAVEPFAQALFTAHIEPVQVGQPGFFDILFAFHFFRCAVEGRGFFHSVHHHIGFLGNAVGIQESPGQVHDFFPSPVHHQTGIFRHFRHHRGFQVFLGGSGHEFVQVAGGDAHGHPFLGFTDGQFRAVQAFVFLGHLVQVDYQARCQFADGHGYPAGPEVVAPFDQPGHFRIPEQPLDLPFVGGIPLLDFCTAFAEGFGGVFLGGTGGAAHAVTAGTAAQQHDQVARSRTFPDHGVPGSSPDDGPHFHSLGHEFGMVVFFHGTGGQTDLVAVGAVAGCSAQGDLPLGQLAFQGLFIRGTGIAGPGDPHGLVHIAPAAEGIPDGPAQAGGGTAEGFDFGGMVVGFVLEHHQPVFFFAVHVNGGHDAAGVDFFGSIQVGDLPFLFQLLGGQACHVHQGDGAFGVGTVDKIPVFLVQVIGFRHRLGVYAIGDGNVFQFGFKSGVPAVVGPVGIQHLDFGNGGIPVFFLEVFLDKGQVFQAHGQFLLVQEVFQAFSVQAPEAVQHGYGFGHIPGHIQGFRLFNGRFLGFHRVDAVFLDFFKVGVGQVTFQQEHFGGCHNGPLSLGDGLDALGGKIFSLVVLAREQFHGKAADAGRDFHFFIPDHIHRCFAEHQASGFLVFFVTEALQIVPVQDPDAFQILQPQGLLEIGTQTCCFHSIFFLLLHKYSSNLVAHDSLP